VALEPEELDSVKAILNEYKPKGVDYHALRSRQAAARKFMVVHLLVPGSWSIARGHKLAEQIENQVRATISNTNIVTHVEPAEDPLSMEDGSVL